ncbi:MAG: hypothetical protein SGJ21_07115 [Alphaproteobacteria bacterium]|nr:hypothetical protein [Alphaproteobacteria bacterium]
MKIDFSGVAAMLIEQVARLTREEQRAFAVFLGSAVATVAKSTRTSIDDVALRSLAIPFAKDFIEGVETRL